MEKYPVIEIFESFQGEGRLMGVPVTFVRFAGCNLACPWCDTREQLNNTSEHTMMTAQEIVDQIKRPDVIFTGGEPTLYDLTAICGLLDRKFSGWDSDFCIRGIETNGTGEVPECINTISCSPKPQTNYFIHDSIKRRESSYGVDYKYVADDILKAENVRVSSRTKGRNITYIQPEFYSGAKSVEKAAALVRELNSRDADIRLGIQAHKYWEVR